LVLPCSASSCLPLLPFWLLSRDATDGESGLSLDFNFVKITTAITTFFEVFYANKCYGKYQKMYEMTQGMFNEVSCYAHLLRIWLRSRCPNHARLALRYAVAATMMHFAHMKGKTSEDDVSDLLSSRILLSNEWKDLQRHDSSQWSLLLLSWSNEVALEGCRQAEEKSASNGMTSSVMKIYTHMKYISDGVALLVPFQYYHLLAKMVASNILLWAYSMGTTDSCFAPLAFVLCTVVFLGMMRLSSALADPFGDDDVDFPMDTWFLQVAELVFAVSEKEYLDGTVSVEQMVAHERFPPRLDHSLHLLGERPSKQKATGHSSKSQASELRCVRGHNPYREMRPIRTT